MSLVSKFLEAVEATETPEAAVEIMSTILKDQVGDCVFLLAEFGSLWVLPNAYIGTFPNEWMELYLKRNFYFDDPIVKHMKVSSAPIRWSDIKTVNASERKVMKLARDHDLVDGVTFLIVRAGYYSSGFMIAGPEVNICDDVLPDLQLASLYFHNHMIAFYQPQLPLAETRADILTRRQIECLSWVASGKTDWEIGEILKIQESTVHTHIEDAKRKLMAVTRAQAVMTAFKAGFIGI